MARRVGFGATVASAVIFSALLISNLALLIGSEQRQKLTAEADAESYLYDGSQVMVASAGLAALNQEQSLVSSRVFPCPGLPEAVANATGTIRASLSEGDLEVNTRLTVGPNSTINDDEGIFLPYNGSIKGNLNVVLESSVRTAAPLLGVRSSVFERHYLNLPAKIDAMESLCGNSLDSAKKDLLAGAGNRCDANAIDATMTAETESLEKKAAGLGLNLRLSYSLPVGPECEVSLVVDVSQGGIVGPGGPFSVRAEGEGSVLLPTWGLAWQA